MKLRELQVQFSEAIRAPQLDELDFLKQIESNHLSATERVEIYRHNYRENLKQSLKKIFPICEQLVGLDFFEMLAHFYRVAQVEVDADIVNYTRQFPRFLSQFEAAQGLPYLPDVARLELAWYDAFLSPDCDFNPHRFASIQESQLEHVVFHLKPSCQLIQSNYPLDQIWQIHQPDFNGNQQVNLDDGGCQLMVFRHGVTIHIDSISLDVYQFLSACRQQLTLAEIQEKYPQYDYANILTEVIKCGYLGEFVIQE